MSGRLAQASLWILVAVGLVCASPLLVLGSYRRHPSEEWPYSRTEHGGRDANLDGTAGALRPPNTPGGYTIDPLKFPGGECIHCHDEHASYEGNTHLENPTLLFDFPENRLCAACHDQVNSPSWNLPWQNGWAGTQRSSVYGLSKHGKTSSGAQWVAGNPYNDILNVLNANLATPAPAPGARKTYEKGSCLSCHSDHGFYPGANNAALMTSQEQQDGVHSKMLSRTMGSQTGPVPAESNAMCNYCHDNTSLFSSGTDHDITSKYYWYKGSTGDGSKYLGYAPTLHRSSNHAMNLFPGNGTYPARTGEKGSCNNCHDPHGGAPGGNINGAAGGSAPSNRMLVAPMIDPNQSTTRNSLCFQCHDQISGNAKQRFLGRSLYQAVKHGNSTSMYWGRTTDTYDGSATSYNVNTASWGPRSTSDYALCLNCHNPHTQTVGSAIVNGTRNIPAMLLEMYHNGNSTSISAYNKNNVLLCLNCHNEARLTSSGNSNTGFKKGSSNLHEEHIRGERSLCSDCHNPHGYNAQHVKGSPPPGSRNISFNTETVTPSSSTVTINGVQTKGPVWFYDATVNGNAHRYGCALTCHGKDHKPQYYTPTGQGPQFHIHLSPTVQGGVAKVVVELGFNGVTPPAKDVEFAVGNTDSPMSVSKWLSLPAASERQSDGDVVFEVPAADWRPGSSHSIFVRVRESDGQWSPWKGKMIGVLPAGKSQIALSYYLDEDFEQPVPTLRGTPILPRAGPVYLNVVAPIPLAGYRLLFGTGERINELAEFSVGPNGTVVEVPAHLTGGDRLRTVILNGRKGVQIPAAGAFAYYKELPQKDTIVEMLASPATLDCDGRSASRIVARVEDLNGQPLSGRFVDFRRTSGGGTLIKESLVTNQRGEAEAKYLAGITAETAVIEALDQSSGASAVGYVRLKLLGSAVINLVHPDGLSRGRIPGDSEVEKTVVHLNVFPSHLPADGLSTANVVATATDARGSPKANVIVKFDVADGNGQIVGGRFVTDATGRAEAYYVAGRSPGDVTITATDSLERAFATATVTLTGTGAAKVKVEIAPSSLPADGRQTAQVVVRVTDLAGRPVSGAAVSIHPRYGYGLLLTGDLTTNDLGEVYATYRAGQTMGADSIIASVLSPLLETRLGQDNPPVTDREQGGVFDTVGGIGSSWVTLGSNAAFGSYGAVPIPDDGIGAMGYSMPRLPSGFVYLLNNLSLAYGFWDERMRLDGPQLANKKLHLESNTWSIRFKKPMRVGLGGLRIAFSSNSNESAQYGWLSRYSNKVLSVRTGGRFFDFLGSYTRTDTATEDLRTNLTSDGDSNSRLATLTLRLPRMPVVTLGAFRSTLHTTGGGSEFGSTLDRTIISAFHQIGQFGLRWTNSRSSQDQGAGTNRSTTDSRYNTIGLTLTQGLESNLGVELSLNRTGTHLESSATQRGTRQTNSNLQVRFNPSEKFVIAGGRSDSNSKDSLLGDRAFGVKSHNLDISYTPFKYLAVQAGARTDQQDTLLGQSEFRTQQFSSSLVVSKFSTLSFSATHSEEPALQQLTGQETSSKSLQLTTMKIIPRTSLTLGWTKLDASSVSGANNTETRSARIQTDLTSRAKMSFGIGKSDLSGETAGVGFTFSTKTQDLTLLWSPNEQCDLAYTFTKLSQVGTDALSDSSVSLLRFTTLLRGNAFLVVEASHNILDQTLLIGNQSQSLKGKRYLMRLNCALDRTSYIYVQYEKTTDDVSQFRSSGLQFGYGMIF